MTATPVARPSWRGLLLVVLPAFVASRLVMVGIVLMVGALPLPYDRVAFAHGPLLSGLTGQDAVYYLGIASDGYHLAPVREGYPDWVFFPAFPLATRVVSLVTFGNVAWAGLLVANSALLLALVLIARIVTDQSDLRTARWTSWLVAFAPGAVAFGWAYGDALLLAASAGGLLAARHQRWGLVALCAAGAVLTRLPGLLLIVPLAYEIWHQDDHQVTRHQVVLLAAPLALMGFAAYQGVALGDPLAFVHGQAAWDLPRFSDASTQYDTSANPPPTSVVAMVALLIGTLMAYTAMLPGLIRSRLPRAEVLLAVVAFATVFLSGRIQSDARYLAAGWPFAWYLASRRGRWPAIWLATSTIAFVVYGLLDTAHLMAP